MPQPNQIYTRDFLLRHIDDTKSWREIAEIVSAELGRHVMAQTLCRVAHRHQILKVSQAAPRSRIRGKELHRKGLLFKKLTPAE